MPESAVGMLVMWQGTCYDRWACRLHVSSKLTYQDVRQLNPIYSPNDILLRVVRVEQTVHLTLHIAIKAKPLEDVNVQGPLCHSLPIQADPSRSNPNKTLVSMLVFWALPE